ncbi:Zn-dependent oxidoreductase [Brenneria goodwinii]|uniref:Starvation sensing protein RspB n=1 Tax=Brenneria goodwinii TaxID=1109412 RepID=A0A0G4JR38_9GAMM|nr:Zn-dependent oxidoreductase [Brenneria goodwinii]MCG8157920.1 Zn-dependent oxidoreductase [Brenneria goodwinii]MCG8163547.1 Zn-dependent oxidoreductase [Brenneria goodwinii]MCG8168104.1 Zn-dependent oxidoreductase [Brenneria goodwinii]MCG8172683.1 Zn-dependent oxidoreductase [Brenneria goodwinii]MCG8177387.1 Zn-dependent oxidoreductase [Brenneria goodwinii]
MKSIVIKQPNDLVIEDRDIPQPASGEVRVKVKLAGICGSDSHIYRGHNPFAKYPRVIGHEFFGIIDAVGEGVEVSRIGERVSVDPVVSCGHCYPCSIGRPNVCSSLVVLGVHRDGGFSDYAAVPAKNAYLIPDEIPDEFAVMVEPFTISANVTAQIKPTEQDVALIYGAGPMGLTSVQVLKGVYQVKEVIVVDRIPERLTMAQHCGATKVINNASLSLKDELDKLNIKPTLIIDAACHPAILQEAITIASPAARIAIMGFSNEPCHISQQGITSKELSIFSSRLNANKFPMVIEWLQQKKIDPAKLITHQFDYEQVVSAIEVFEKDQKSCCKVLLEFDE